MEQRIGDPSPNYSEVEIVFTNTNIVQLRMFNKHPVRHVLVQHSHGNNGKQSPSNVVRGKCGLFEQCLSGESVEDGEPELGYVQDDVLIERVEDDLGNTAIRVASVDKEQSLEETELSDRVVTGASSLETLFSGDTDTNVSSLYVKLAG